MRIRKNRAKDKAPLNSFQEFFYAEANRQHKDFDLAVQEIHKIYSEYGVYDVAASLFISCIWLPNIASPIKHQLLAAIFASFKPEEFSNSKSINNYSEFTNFLEKIHAVLPTFFMLEDYIPEIDWGDVKFYNDQKIYKIFYGQELCNVNEYLTLFQMLYLPFDEEYQTITSRSPSKELRYCLQLQDEIILAIDVQPKPENIKNISPGHMETPPIQFWEKTLEFYKNFDLTKKYDAAFIGEYSIKLGSYPADFLNCDKFQEKAYAGKVLPKFFINHKEKYYPILPRRYSSILFDSWSLIFKNNHRKVVSDRISYRHRLEAELYGYIKTRIQCGFLEPMVSALMPDRKPHKLIFSLAFISKNKLILVYVTNPCVSAQNTIVELNNISADLQEAVELVRMRPNTLALHLDRKDVQFNSGDKELSLTPELIVVIPQTSTSIESINLPNTFPGRLFFMDHFLGIIDELNNPETFSSFIEYWDEYGHLINDYFITPLDIFGSFKDSHGVLLEGAVEYDFVHIDPHWGSGARFRTLKEFWQNYPEVHFFDHPRSWKIKKETESRLRLEARGYFGCALYCKVGSTHIFINSPFNDMDYKQVLISNMLMESLEDSLSRNASILLQHCYFQQASSQFQVLFFPASLASSAKYKHLKHLIPESNELWRSDTGVMVPGIYGIRVVFNDDHLMEVLETIEDRSIEVALVMEIVKELNGILPTHNMQLILASLEDLKKGKPRFKVMRADRQVSFPEFVNYSKPELIHFKKARKRISELAKQQGFNPGIYSLDDAKLKIDIIKRSMIDEIYSEVNACDYRESIPFLLARIDALTDHHVRSTFKIRKSLEHDVDFDREENYSKDETSYIGMHKNYRYLIEKFVQLQPQGTKNLDTESFQYLIALIDWLHVLYSASDSLWYGLDPALGMNVNDQYLVEVNYAEDISLKEDIFSKEIAKEKLGIGINLNDNVQSSRSMPDFIKSLDLAFKKDMGFTFTNMIHVLQVFSFWAAFNGMPENKAFYVANSEEIKNTCKKAKIDFDPEQSDLILNFLTLRGEDVIKILGQETPCDDIPIWEHRKRFSRYVLRPLIFIDNKYYWGPHSAKKSSEIWTGSLSRGCLPTDLESPAIREVMDGEKNFIEKALEKKAYEIVCKFTPHAINNCILHKRDRSGGHPIDLGDYDVLALYCAKNVVINIECKDNLPPFCLKDATRLRRKIFGDGKGYEGHFKYINRRKDYLLANVKKVADGLRWPVDSKNLPRIVTIYLTRNTYWWTRFPPYDTGATFLKISQLSNFIERL